MNELLSHRAVARAAGATAAPKAVPLMCGSFALEAPAPHSADSTPTLQLTDRLLTIEAPGLQLTLDAARVTWHLDERQVLVAAGRPRLKGRDLLPQIRGGLTAALASELLAALDEGAIAGRFLLLHVDLIERRWQALTDRFAVLPLCLAQHGRSLSFSDRADAVARLTSAGIDRQALYDYLYFHMIPAPRTIFAGVTRLTASTQAVFDTRGLSLRRHWRPHFEDDGAPEAARRNRFQQVLADAVASDVRDVPQLAVGAYLSGGTDSTSVSALLKRTLASPPKLFSIGFNAAGYDEMNYARLAAQSIGAEHVAAYVTPEDVTQALPRVAAFYDQPFGNSSALPAYCCAQLAASRGVRRLLAGDGGDELFGGNARYARQLVFERYGRLWPWTRRRLEAWLLDAQQAPRSLAGLRKAASYVSQARQPLPARLETYNLLKRVGPAQILTPAVLRAVDDAAPAALQAEVYGAIDTPDVVDRLLAYDWRFTLTDNDLPKVTGTAQMAGLEVGFPMLDDAVLDFACTLPPELKVHGAELRPFFKSALSDLLPPQIIAKKKHGFGLPFGPWLLQHAPLARRTRESIDRLVARGIVPAPLPRQLFDTLLPAHAPYYGELAWVLASLSHWLDAHAPGYLVEH